MNGVRVTERKPMSAKEQRDVYNKALIHRALKEGSKQ